MSEIKTPPISWLDEGGDKVVGFTAEHTLADIARWIMENPVDAKELHLILGELIKEFDSATT